MRALLLVACLASACGPTITLTDDIDVTWDFAPTLDRFDSTLHAPYVRGTKTTLYVSSSDDKQDFSGWTIASVDPSVVTVAATAQDSQGLSAMAQAVGAGSTDLVVLDGQGKVVGRGHADVALPDRVELDAHGYLIIGQASDAPVPEARILEGGEATYLVRYYHGDDELHGNGVLTTGQADDIVAEPRTSFLFENREWLSITSTAQGVTSLPMLVDGTPINDVQVVTVAETDIDGVSLLAQSEKGASDGDWFVTLAQSYDTAGRRIFGVDYAWDLDGSALDAEGDLYRYEYKGGQFQMVTASIDGHQDSAQIQSDKGYVDSTNNVGCAATGGASSPLLVLGALGLLRRRSHRAALRGNARLSRACRRR